MNDEDPRDGLPKSDTLRCCGGAPEAADGWCQRPGVAAMLRADIMKHLRRLLPLSWLAVACLGVAPPAGAQTAAQAATQSGAQTLALPDELLALVNAQRAAGATCGDELLPPAPPLQWHGAMEAAAADHLQDVATRGVLSHDGSDGSTVGGRLRRHAYAWGGVGENVAAGNRSPVLTLQQWLRSPAHCRTLMQANYRHLGVVGRHVPGSRHDAWWVMVVARPLQ